MTKVLGIFGFLQFGWADILDIGMVALLIYLLLRSIRGDSTVLNIVLVLSLLLVGQAIASALNMRMMTVLLSALLDVGVLAIIIIFQPEIRHLLNRVAMQTPAAPATCSTASSASRRNGSEAGAWRNWWKPCGPCRQKRPAP